MKPITLMIAGLHSFREKQVIDFESLCEGGVFGIFGPTGSGKSSILDGMTLALYGKVERASNNTQGIMNHAENQLEVSFLFELENAKGKQRFKVERTFKRTDDIRVKSGISRLTEVKEDEHIVIADKASEVNQAIQEILGLTIDDFTRAVVLPQGKFAEFLSLKGADRRQMLQRLFQLEKYGDQLSRKIKEELQEKTRLLGEIHAEQLGLGEASDEAVQEAEKAFKEVETLVKSSEKALQEMEHAFEQKKKQWERQLEKAQVEKKLQSFLLQEASIKKLETSYTLAVQAESLKSLLVDLKEVEKALLQWKQRNKLDQTANESAIEALNKALSTYEATRVKKESELPVLLARKEKLERARNLEEGLTSHHPKMEELKRSLDSNKEVFSKLHNQEEKAKELYTKAVNKQKTLKDELGSLAFAPARLELLQKAFDKKQEILLIEKKMKENGAEVDSLQNKISTFQADNQKAEANLNKGKESLLEIFQSTEKHYDQASKMAQQLDWLERQLEQFLEAEQKLADDIKIHQLALELAKSLEEGDACPVCGSTVHPGLASHQAHREVASSKEENGIGKLPSAISFQKQENLKIKLKLEQIASELHRDLEGEKGLPSPKESSEKWDLWDREWNESKDTAGLIAEKYHRISTEQKALIQDLIQLQQKKEKVDNYLQKWTGTFKETEKLASSYMEQRDEWKKRQEETQKDLLEKKSKWERDFVEETFEEIETTFQAAKENEKHRIDLQERINTSVDFIESKEKELKVTQEKKREIEKNIYQEELQLEQVLNRMKDTQEEIKSIAGENNIQDELKRVEYEVESLNKKERENYQQWIESQQHAQEKEKAASQSEQMVRESESRLAFIQEKWKHELDKSVFTATDEVERSIVHIESKVVWKEQIEQYWEERKAVEKDLSRLNVLIGTDILEEDEWEKFREQLQFARKELRDEIERKSALQQNLLSLKERNERFRILEEKKKKLTEETQAYQKLQSVFKGNSFVEYLAEEQLLQISRDASERLGQLTRQRYALEMDSNGGFIIRDDANGGVRRPVSTLSGGETFLTSLALALSLSAQIQLRGEYPLQFFFLDEGFGTLDAELLDAVVTALEKLQSDHLAVGVISHVQELRARLPRRLVVTPAKSSGNGSVVTLENL
ncbi:SbcC/MukB-like Walker B domain-containing protein [Bacillus sp. RO1]|uniref:SbcC/MukB-like Walker B domain-containing protein n=1 Tax=Bacillus sp. RO1 TaxID=2722703 RepID=UPI0014567A5C|nr:SbcC/MukB-like Walker B domain-containing protein [Bacillus sp. RO1]NLP50003.1 AAA family ATPase [Bacillus sp. RO1]